MATVKFVGYVLVPAGKNPDRIVLGDVDLPAGMLPPKPGLTLLHGFKIAHQVVAQQMALAEERRQKLYLVNLAIDGGPVPPGHTAAEDLPEIKFLNLGRSTMDIGSVVAKYWRDFLPKDISPEMMEKLAIHSNGQIVISRPDLIGELHNQPEFRHLDAIAYRIRGTQPLTTVATIFSLKGLISVECETDPNVEIVLPQLDQD